MVIGICSRVIRSTFYQAFDAALLTHTFVFIGSGYNDPDVNLLLENQNFGFPAQAPHYFLCAEGMDTDRKSSLRENRNLKVLEYDKVDEQHTGLVGEVERLRSLVEAEIGEVWEAINW